MRTLVALAFVTALACPVHAQICNPDCATQPAACCAVPQADQFLAEQCTTASSTNVHFVVPGLGEGWVENRVPSTLNPAIDGLTGHITLGDVLPVTVGFQLGTTAQTARFQTVNTSLVVTGQCVATFGDTFAPSLPSMISVQGRGLQVLTRNPFFCRSTGSPDVLCFGVKGQVGPPFQAQTLCAPDRVEFVCSAVLP